MYASRNPVTSEINTVKSDIKDILQSGNYYCTEEIANELTKINNGLDHINLDDNILTTSRTWQNNFDPRQTMAHRNNLVSTMDKTSAMLFDLKSQLNMDKLKDKQENELREKHEWALNNLDQVQQNIDPFAATAANRIHQFSDHIGVTDRFTNYRNNKMRVPQPTRTQTQQMMRLERARTSIGTPLADLRTKRYGTMGSRIQYGDFKPPEKVYKGYRTIDSLYPRSTTMIKPGVTAQPSFTQTLSDIKTINSLNAMDQTKTKEMKSQQLLTASLTNTKSAAERAGINVIFPGTTLYSDEYIPPNLNLPTSHFVINPRPNFVVDGRTLGRSEILPPTSSEYQSRYAWPQGSQMRKLPWLNVH
ncbi:hypothetical protein LOTGIDRAFT_235976 [Lottia gigantea]|uniref:Uncharacterized protein n=1 Tax=Lottia gigantea TaxID=225164 RepID=V3ZQW7_LOTGI|nr:hypothetical protein LOTGIDRAFT_235976 [Lottia gigantea]ESO84905.1 hypothetical protein LOTGIDRAFT_235976 [Lottia gigantea]